MAAEVDTLAARKIGDNDWLTVCKWTTIYFKCLAENLLPKCGNFAPGFASTVTVRETIFAGITRIFGRCCLRRLIQYHPFQSGLSSCEAASDIDSRSMNKHQTLLGQKTSFTPSDAAHVSQFSVHYTVVLNHSTNFGIPSSIFVRGL